ncbi:MAG: type II toxin-antitoxin system RelE/ParE family toxin [Gammaproteobacteria bacterium]|nr:type II toxin-antitoxin system RelE/ParE family toxin [Gammaproteobacteria bacterium]
MIGNFIGRATRDIYDGVDTRHSRKLPVTLHPRIRRLLDQINAANSPDVLRKSPGNRLEKLGGRLQHFWSVRVNSQWRVMFQSEGRDAVNVQIVDYHD